MAVREMPNETNRDPMRKIDLLLLDVILTRSTSQKSFSQFEAASNFCTRMSSQCVAVEIRQCPFAATQPPSPALPGQT